MTKTLRVLVATLLCLVTFAAACPPAWADAKQRHEAYDQRVRAELDALAPAATPMFDEANKLRMTDPAKALPLYEQVSVLAPGFAPAVRRRAQVLAEMGRRPEALALARQAAAMSPANENKTALALILAHGARGVPPELSETAEAVALMRQVSVAAPKGIDEQLWLCEVLLSTQRVEEIRSCAAAAIQFAPDEPEPYVFAALASAMDGDRDAAYASVEKARSLGLEPRLADRLTSAIDSTEPPLFRWGKRFLAVVGLWLVGLFGLYALGGALSKMTLRFVERLSPDREQPHHGLLRNVYRALLNAASLYYYVSLPLVLLLAVLAGAGVIIGFLYIGRIPIYIFLVVGTLVLVTIVSVVKSLFMRWRDVDPGVPLDLREHARLRAVIEEVADRVGTRVVDTVYLTPDTQIAVLERGSMLNQLRGNTERCLVLGVGVLDGMKMQPFKAVLAHEYGHFSNRDTAGGGAAIAVRRSLLHTAIGLAQGGGAVWYSPMWHFVVTFQRIFLRISQGASRLQEVMADRIAAFAYGPEAFAAGLDHVVRRGVAFGAHVDATLGEVVDQGRPLTNLYQYAPAKPVDAEEIGAEVKKGLEQEPSPYDSHPSPVDRIAWVRRLSATSIASSADDDVDAWSLFASRAEIEERMTQVVRRRLGEQGIHVATEEQPAVEAPAASD